MARIDLVDVHHRYRDTSAGAGHLDLKPLDLTWQDGGAYALLGPSGCGKTTLLNIISGLLRPSKGRVLFDGRDVTDASPQARNIAQVFQFPVLYETMTVFDNLAFPLRNRKVPPAVVRERVARIGELLELTEDLPRKAIGMTSELKQRISLGRGLVREDVSAILLDEPLTVIDPHVKWLLRRKLMQIHAELSVTLVYVTHDQVEALTLADRVVVMKDGGVLQQGTPQELFETPAHTFVGHFIGSPGMNLVECQLDGQDAVFPGGRLALPQHAAAPPEGALGGFVLGIRPEQMRLHGRRPPDRARALPARITRVEDTGRTRIVRVLLGEQQPLSVVVPENNPVPADGSCWLEFPLEATHLYRDGLLVAPRVPS